MSKDEQFKILTDHQHIRLRTEMYLGSRVAVTASVPIVRNDIMSIEQVTYVPAILTAFREALDNALDELSFVGKGQISVDYDELMSSFVVTDNGRGIPLDFIESENSYMPTVAVSKTKAGRNFNERGETAGVNGLGISVVNSVSDTFKVTVIRDGKIFRQSFKSDSDILIANEPTIKSHSGKTGTTVEFSLSSDVFEDLRLPTEMVYSLLYLIAATKKNIKIRFNGSLIKTHNKIEQALFGKDHESITIDINDDDVRMKFILKTFKDSEFHVFSLVNNIPAFDGGSHVNEFRISLTRNLLDALSREAKKRKLNLIKSDVTNELLIFNVTTMKAPNFDSQSKTRLINSELRYKVLKNLNSLDWRKFVRENRDFVERIFKRAEFRLGSDDTKVIDKEAKKLKKEKIPNLIDATSRDRSECVLALFEGNSAASSFATVRDPKKHGCLPLRGKVKNVWGQKPLSALNSDALKQICAAFGIMPGKKINEADLRYQKVVIATDADEDGMNIRALLISFFYNYWPEMFDKENPRVFFWNMPIIVISKGKTRKYFYPGDEFDMADWKGWKFDSRLKGLGSMTIENWKDNSIENAIPIYDDGKLRQTLELLSDATRADDRKEMMKVSVDETLERLDITNTEM